MQLQGYFLNLFFILPMQLPYNIARWQGRGFAQFACCQWVELMVKLVNLQKLIAKWGINQQEAVLIGMNLVQLWYFKYNNISTAKRQDNGMSLDDRQTLQENKAHGFDVWSECLPGIGEYAKALDESKLHTHRWKGQNGDVPRDGPLMEMQWHPLIESELEDHRKRVEEQRKKEADMAKKRAERAKAEGANEEKDGAKAEGANEEKDGARPSTFETEEAAEKRQKETKKAVARLCGADALEKATAEHERKQAARRHKMRFDEVPRKGQR